MFNVKKPKNLPTMPALDKNGQREWLLQKEREMRLPKHNQFMPNDLREKKIQDAYTDNIQKEEREAKYEKEQTEMTERNRAWKAKMGLL